MQLKLKSGISGFSNKPYIIMICNLSLSIPKQGGVLKFFLHITVSILPFLDQSPHLFQFHPLVLNVWSPVRVSPSRTPGCVRMDSDQRDLKNILMTISPRTTTRTLFSVETRSKINGVPQGVPTTSFVGDSRKVTFALSYL
jgi:hypothetical protein